MLFLKVFAPIEFINPTFHPLPPNNFIPRPQDIGLKGTEKVNDSQDSESLKPFSKPHIWFGGKSSIFFLLIF